MTLEKVKHDVILGAVGYVVSLLLLLLWPNREAADQNLVYLIGLAILILVGAALDWVVFNWRPSRPTFDLLAFVTQTGPRALNPRPRRFAIPQFLGFLAAYTFASSLRYSALPDWGITAFAVSAPLFLGAFSASNALWAISSKSAETARADDGAGADRTSP